MPIDAHCHLSLLPETQISSYLQAAEKLGISRIVMAGYGLKDASAQLQIIRKNQTSIRLEPCFGLHPWTVIEEPGKWQEDWDKLEALISQAKFIGETGIDHFRVEGKEQNRAQEESFIAHLELARSLKKPLVLHVVQAHGLALKWLRTYPPQAGGLVHGFTGSSELAREYLDLGFKISIGPNLLNPKFKKLQDTARILPLDALLLETDHPWDLEGAPASPSTLEEVAQALARLRQIDVARLWPQVETNLTGLSA